MTVRTGVRALRARAGAGRTAPTSSSSTTARPPRATSSCSPSAASFPIDDLGLEHYGIDTTGRTPFPRDGRLRIADGLWVIGDPAGPELHTHQAHYQGEIAVRMALGEAVMPDYRALPRATYTDPEAASVGLTLEEALRPRSRRVRAGRRLRQEHARATRSRRRCGHVTIVVDRRSRQLVGAAMACPDASAAIHECVLAIKARVTIDVLADTIHAFPSTSRIFNGLFADAAQGAGRGAAVARRRGAVRSRRRPARP